MAPGWQRWAARARWSLLDGEIRARQGHLTSTNRLHGRVGVYTKLPRHKHASPSPAHVSKRHNFVFSKHALAWEHLQTLCVGFQAASCVQCSRHTSRCRPFWTAEMECPFEAGWLGLSVALIFPINTNLGPSFLQTKIICSLFSTDRVAENCRNSVANFSYKHQPRELIFSTQIILLFIFCIRMDKSDTRASKQEDETKKALIMDAKLEPQCWHRSFSKVTTWRSQPKNKRWIYKYSLCE